MRNTTNKNTSTPKEKRNLTSGISIIARASVSILHNKPHYTKEDRHALSVLSEYGI